MLIVGTSLSHSFPGQPELFTELSFSWSGGDLIALRGASGSGKSTLLSMLAGWLTPSAGAISRTDVSTTTWVSQSPYGTAGRTALDHACLPLLVSGMTRSAAETAAKEVLETFGLAKIVDTPFGALSGGEAQRLMLARAVLSDADLVLIDEPTAQLDPQNASTITAVLGNLAGDGRIVVVSTHDERVAARCHATLALGA